MKKLVFAAALALCAAANAEIASSTTVGYTTKTLEAGKWYLVGAGFEGVGTELTVQNFVSGLTAGTVGSAPTIQYWNGTKLETLYYITGAFDMTSGNLVTGWADNNTMASTLVVNPGWGCWIKVPVAATITLSGQVVNADTKDLTLTSSWQLAGNPFPVATGVNSATMDCTGLTAGSVGNAPTIQYWNGTKLETLYYITGAFDMTSGNLVTGWADNNTMASTLVLDPCTGFWVKSPTGGKIVWKK